MQSGTLSDQLRLMCSASKNVYNAYTLCSFNFPPGHFEALARLNCANENKKKELLNIFEQRIEKNKLLEIQLGSSSQH